MGSGGAVEAPAGAATRPAVRALRARPRLCSHCLHPPPPLPDGPSWLRRVILPNLHSEALERLPLGNWHTWAAGGRVAWAPRARSSADRAQARWAPAPARVQSGLTPLSPRAPLRRASPPRTVAEARAQIAVLTDDRALWRGALSLWRRAAGAYLRPCGECAETARDLYHSQFGLGGLAQCAELAHHQGEDLFGFQGGLVGGGVGWGVWVGGREQGARQGAGLPRSSRPRPRPCPPAAAAARARVPRGHHARRRPAAVHLPAEGHRLPALRCAGRRRSLRMAAMRSARRRAWGARAWRPCCPGWPPGHGHSRAACVRLAFTPLPLAPRQAGRWR